MIVIVVLGDLRVPAQERSIDGQQITRPVVQLGARLCVASIPQFQVVVEYSANCGFISSGQAHKLHLVRTYAFAEWAIYG